MASPVNAANGLTALDGAGALTVTATATPFQANTNLSSTSRNIDYDIVFNWRNLTPLAGSFAGSTDLRVLTIGLDANAFPMIRATKLDLFASVLVNGSLNISGSVNAAGNFSQGGGSFTGFTSPQVNTVIPGSAATFIPVGTVLNSTPALVVERTVLDDGNPSNEANPTLFVGTHYTSASTHTPQGFSYGLYDLVSIDANASGNGYVEAARVACDQTASLTQYSACWGLVARVTSDSLSVRGTGIGVESEVDQNVSDAPLPGNFSQAAFSTPFLASGGASYASPSVYRLDAAFLVNPGTPSGGFQVGFSCPSDQNSYQHVAIACFWSNGKSQVGLDLQYGTWTVAQITGVNFSVDPLGDVWAASGAFTGAPVTTFTNQVSYGGVWSTITSKCGTLSGATGCVELNVSGTMRWVPFF